MHYLSIGLLIIFWLSGNQSFYAFRPITAQSGRAARGGEGGKGSNEKAPPLREEGQC